MCWMSAAFIGLYLDGPWCLRGGWEGGDTCRRELDTLLLLCGLAVPGERREGIEADVSDRNGGEAWGGRGGQRAAVLGRKQRRF